jgi:hypothetical protein
VTDLHHRISQDVMHLCMRDERKTYVVEDKVGIWVDSVERDIGDINVVVAKALGSSSLILHGSFIPFT